MPTALPTIQVTPLKHTAGFGCVVTGADLMDLDEPSFKIIEGALYEHKLVIIKDQKNLTANGQHEFNKRFDPDASGLHGHGNGKHVATNNFRGKKNITAGLPAVPENEMIRVVGKGKIPAGHFGFEEDVPLPGATHAGFHKEAMSPEDLDAGYTRFQRWHIDAQFFPLSNHTARVTTLWAHTLPKGPNVTIRFDDGSGQEISCPPGRTAFLSGVSMWEGLSAADKKWVEHSKVEYAPSPYEWIINCKGLSNGFGLVSEDLETPIEDLPNHDGSQCQILPLLWPNPVTGEKALMYHAIIVRKIHYRESADGPVTIMDNVRQVREKLYNLQRPFLKEENIIFAEEQEEGDLALWSNRQLRHCPVEQRRGLRLCHQCHLMGSDDVANPSPIKGLTPGY